MYGIIGAYGSGKNLDLSLDFTGREDFSQDFVQASIKEDNFVAQRKTLNRFTDDKIWTNTEDMYIGLEGTVLNSNVLKAEWRCSTISDVIRCAYQKMGAELINILNGVFALVIIDKKSDKVYIFSSHIGYKPVYYYINEKQILFSTDIAWMYNTVRNNGLRLLLDHDGAYCMLSMGYMLGNKTLAKDVHRVESGEYVCFCDGRSSINKYFDLDIKTRHDMSYDELLKRADTLFCQAICRIYDKDKEYGYRHFCTLSGGLDSRCIAVVAHDLGYTDQLLVTFGQSGTQDVKIASQIAADFGMEHITYDLDGGGCFLEFEKAVKSNGGLISFPGYMGMNKICELFYDSRYGMVHTGMIGDLLFGGSYEKYNTDSWGIANGAFSEKLLNNLSIDFRKMLTDSYSNGKTYCLENRGVNACENGFLAANCFTEASSAFIDKDFLTFILSVPSEYLKNSRFYTDWMKKYHPNLCREIWTATLSKPGANRIVCYAKRMKRRFLHDLFGVQHSLNPFELWYEKNNKFRSAIDHYYRDHIDLIPAGKIRDDIGILFEGTIYEKMMAITLLASISVFDFTYLQR